MRSLAYVITGATELVEIFKLAGSEAETLVSDFIGSPPALSPSLTGFLRTDNPVGGLSVSSELLTRAVFGQAHAAIQSHAELGARFHHRLLLFLVSPAARAERAADERA